MFQSANRSPVTGQTHAQQLQRWLTACALTLGLAAAPAWAVHAGQWQHDSEADFTAGKMQDTVVTNLGDIKLAAQTQAIGEMPEEATIIYDLEASESGDIYIAAGPQARLLVRQGEKIEELLTLENEQIFTLDKLSNGQLLVGISGEKSRLAVLQKDNTLKTLVDLPDTRYVWDMKVRGKAVYLATGTEGKLLKVDLSDKDKPVIQELLDANQANLLCLVMNDKGVLYTGSDTDGLVYRVTPQAKGDAQVFVVYDADEPEIGALWLNDQGVLYVGTADAEQARPGRLEAASQGGQGRPDVSPAVEGQTPAPAQPDQPAPDQPKPGDIPQVPPKPSPIVPPDQAGEAPSDKPGQQIGEGTAGEGADAQPPSGTAKPSPQASQWQNPQLIALQQAADAQAEAEASKIPQPTAQQRDELREVIRARLQQARQSGALQAGPGGTRINRRIASPSGPSGINRPGAGGSKQGNAVYQITPDGFVSEIFRESVMVLHLTGLPDGSILIATGNEGRLLRVDPTAAEISRLVKLESQQITSILQGPDGDLLLATANPATLARFSPEFAEEGQFTSVVMDASQISLFGQLSVIANIPTGTQVLVQTRSGNVSDPEKAPWSEWSEPTTLSSDDTIDALTPRGLSVQSPPARFLQYMLTLKAADGKSPHVDRVNATFVVPNLKPTVSSITLNVPGTPPPQPGGNPSQPRPIGRSPQMGGPASTQAASGNAPPTMEITWEASDPNNDQLTYTLEYRPASAQVWLPLAKNLKENRYEWQTRRIPDGRYIVRVTASDASDNTPQATKTDTRASDPVLVDNTPPELLNVKTTTPGKGQLIVTGRVKDALSLIRGIQYVVDAGEEWKYVVTDDLIYDSTDESFTVRISDLAPGQHVVTLRADDGRGNAIHEALIVDIK